jgi:uncharacterized protein with PIN domain
MTIGRNRRQFIELDKENIVVEEYDNSSRQIPGYSASVDERKHSFRDVKQTFTEEQVKAETARCLGCGASVVDETSVSAAVSAPPNVNLMRFICSENIRSAAVCISLRTR